MAGLVHRAATLSYTLVDDIHSLVDDPRPGAGRLSARVRKLLIAGLIISGTTISTVAKIAFEVEAIGRDGVAHNFEKPWFMVLLMFIAMAMCLPMSLCLDFVRGLSLWRQRYAPANRSNRSKWYRSGGAPERTPLLEGYYVDIPGRELHGPGFGSAFAAGFVPLPPPSAPSTVIGQRRWLRERQLLLLLVPTAFDLGSTALLNVGLVFITASATQMLRQSLLLFAALLARLWFKKPLNKYHKLGLTGCVAGLAMVSGAVIASGYSGNAKHSHPQRLAMALGVVLVLLSQLLQAVQLLADQGYPSGGVSLSPLKVVGAEGTLGVLIMVSIALPLLSVGGGVEGHGAREDSIDTLIMLRHSLGLQLLLLVHLGAMQAYSICGMIIAGELDTVSTTLLQALRTLFVWLVCLLLRVSPMGDTTNPYYIYSNGPAGTTTPAAAASSIIDWSRTGHISPSSLVPGAVLHQHPSLSKHIQPLEQQQQQQVLQGYVRDNFPVAAGAAGGSRSLNSISGIISSSSSSFWSITMPHIHQVLGEPWTPWSLLQGAGFLLLVGAAVLYSRGDNDRQQQQLLEEAALLLLDRPPSFSESYGHGSVRFRAYMDIDTASVIRSMARSPACGSTMLATPSRQRSGTLAAELLLEEDGEAGQGGLGGEGDSIGGQQGGLRGNSVGVQRVLQMSMSGEEDSLGYRSWFSQPSATAAAGGRVSVAGDEEEELGVTIPVRQRRESGLGELNGISISAGREGA